MNSPDPYLDQLAAYAAGGLSPDERLELEAQIASRADLAQELRLIQSLEQTMNAALIGAIPSADFENRLIHRLRHSPKKRRWIPRGVRIHPAVRHAALATAAMIVLGGAGFVGSTWMETGKLPNVFADARPSQALASLRGIGQAASNEKKDADPSQLASDGPAVFFDSNGAVPADSGGTRMFRSRFTEGNSTFNAGDSDGDSVADSSGLVKRGSGAIALGWSESTSKARNTEDKITLKKAIISSGVDGLTTVPWSDQQAHRELVLNGNNKYTGATAVSGGVLNFSVPTANPSAFKPAEFGFALRTGVAVPSDGTLLSGGQLLTPGLKASQDTKESPGDRLADRWNAPDSSAPRAGDHWFAQADSNVVPKPAEQVKPAAAAQKIIRNGEMEFEVDSFDKTFATVTAVVIEEGGYVGSTNSDKLPNGKVKGSVMVRVPADRLDTLVLKLRALGDLKSQRITAQDITREYTDLQSELRAGRAMEERLLAIIKDGTGAIKDLLEAEKELANWRGKIEKTEGQINYYNNLVALSTLNLTLTERNIETAATAIEREEINAGIEAEDVDAARTRALKEIAGAQGRIVTSELKQMDAGQLAAKIVVDVAPDAAGPLMDLLKQLGKVARFDLNRQLTTPDNQPSKAPTRVDRKDTRITLSIYNIVTVQPRTMTNVDLAVEGRRGGVQSDSGKCNEIGRPARQQ